MLRRMIRGFALTIVGLCLAAAVFAMLPGSVTYRDRHRCTERVRPMVFTMEHGDRPRDECVPDLVAVGTTPAADFSIALFLLPMISCGLIVAVRGRPLGAALWSVATLGITAVVLSGGTFTLGPERTETLWASYALSSSIMAIYALLLAQLVAIGIRAMLRR